MTGSMLSRIDGGWGRPALDARPPGRAPPPRLSSRRGSHPPRRRARGARPLPVALPRPGGRDGRPRARGRHGRAEARDGGRRGRRSERRAGRRARLARRAQARERARGASGSTSPARGRLDVGASTGGFTDCLLQAGAASVIALDVGYGQLDWRLRTDPRVHVMERVNAARDRAGRPALRAGPGHLRRLVHLGRDGLAGRARHAGARLAGAGPGEAPVRGRPRKRSGRAASCATRTCARRPCRRSRRPSSEAGGRVLGSAESGLPGPKGNREVFLHAVDAATAS